MSPGRMLHGQMSIWQLSYIVKSEWVIVKDGPRKLTMKFGQNWVSNSWDIVDMDKYFQDKCCIDKHPFDNCLRLSRVKWKIVKDCPRKLGLKFCQNRVSNSWDIFDNRNSWDIIDMDKCRQDKWSLDRCPYNNCLRLSRVNG